MLSHYFTIIDRRTVRYFKEKLQQITNLMHTRASKGQKPRNGENRQILQIKINRTKSKLAFEFLFFHQVLYLVFDVCGG